MLHWFKDAESKREQAVKMVKEGETKKYLITNKSNNRKNPIINLCPLIL